MTVTRGALLGALLIGLVLALAAPAVLPGFAVSILALVFIAALLASSINMLIGQVGLLSLGHAGIAATAGYAVAWAAVRDHDVIVQLALAALATVIVSAIYAVTTMRSQGIVFLMITLALGMIVYGLAFRLASVTGGQNGLTGVTRPALVADTNSFYWLTVAVFVAVVVGLWAVRRSPYGLTLRGVRDSESRMASLGYSVVSIKFSAMMLSGLIAGLAGILVVWHAQFMSPAAAAFGRSALAVVMVILGGTGTLAGPLVGATIVVGTEHWLSSYVERWPTLLGLVFIFVILFARRGVVGELAAVADRFGRRSSISVAASSAVLESGPLSVGKETSTSREKEEEE